MITTYAALVTAENIDDIIKDAAKWQLNVDYLKSNYQMAVEDDMPIYAILSVNYDYRHATFTEMDADDFEDCWTFTGATHGPHFRVVVLKD